ncbi:hypothetical protein RHCRD62_30569 [Rhodococcus sp. RD6.2]|nr:hypothetical protein RHCRD62_30569 [Rhodococcus sp. RD6.2]
MDSGAFGGVLHAATGRHADRFLAHRHHRWTVRRLGDHGRRRLSRERSGPEPVQQLEGPDGQHLPCETRGVKSPSTWHNVITGLIGI